MSQHKKRHQFVIDGYIRGIESTLDNKIIPQTINQIIFLYYYACNILYYLLSASPGLYAHDIDRKQTHKFMIYKLNQKDKTSDPASTGYASIFIAKNMILPPKIDEQMHKLHGQQKLTEYHVLFRCAGNASHGDSAECAAVVFDPNQMDTTNSYNDLRAYHWCLPDLPKTGFWGSNTTYSNIYGLFCIGGWNQNTIYQLSIDDISEHTQWKLVAEMKHNTSYTSSIMLNEHSIFISGGWCQNASKRTNRTLLLDLKTYKLETLKSSIYEHQCSGICDDKQRDRIYIAGSNSESSTFIEYYDTTKQEWYVLKPKLKHYYSYYPALWISDNNYNILNIAGSQSKHMEVIDIRSNTINSIQDCSLKEIFNTEIIANCHAWMLH